MTKEHSELASRDALSAAIMAFAPATDVPRDRALIRTALVSLIRIFNDSPFSKEDAIKAISRNEALPELRQDLVSDLFKRLQNNHIVSSNGNSTYKIDSELLAKASAETQNIRENIELVTYDLFPSGSIPEELRPILSRNCLLIIGHLMKDYGYQIACQVLGKAKSNNYLNYTDLQRKCRAFLDADLKNYLSPDEMADAISELFSRDEARFARFVFSLTQNYYYMRLLAMDRRLESLSEERFMGTQFFLDTNLLPPFLFQCSRHHRSIQELATVARRLSISLYVTEFTIAEMRAIIRNHRVHEIKAFDCIPDDLLPKVKNEFLHAYRDQKKNNPDLTPASFLDNCLNFKDDLNSNWGITVFDQDIESLVDKKEIDATKKILGESSVLIRHRRKRDAALIHDTHLFYIIMKDRDRSGSNSAWLLTLDNSLSHAAKTLQHYSAVPFCMSLDGFLQAFSPYVRSDHEQSFADMFVELVGQNIMLPEETLEIGDFRMFTDFDVSIQALPGEDVKRIIRHVKQEVKGSTYYSEDERKMVVYEVQKALADPTLGYKKSIEAEIGERNARIAKLESARQEDNDHYQMQIDQINQETSQEIALLKQANEHQNREIKNLTATIDNAAKQKARRIGQIKSAFKVVVPGIVCLSIATAVWIIPKDFYGVNRSVTCISNINLIGSIISLYSLETKNNADYFPNISRSKCYIWSLSNLCYTKARGGKHTDYSAR